MKAAIFTAALFVSTAVSSFAQGSVILKNFGGGSNGSISPTATVTDKLTGDKVGGSAFLVQLYWGAAGAAEDNLVAIGTPIAMLANGLFGSPTLTIPGIAIGAQAAVQARVWEASGGATYEEALGKSRTGAGSVVTVTLGDAGSTTPNSVPTLVGMAPFTVAVVPVPEPATLALAGIGGLGLLIMRRKQS